MRTEVPPSAVLSPPCRSDKTTQDRWDLKNKVPTLRDLRGFYTLCLDNTDGMQWPLTTREKQKKYCQLATCDLARARMLETMSHAISAMMEGTECTTTSEQVCPSAKQRVSQTSLQSGCHLPTIF